MSERLADQVRVEAAEPVAPEARLRDLLSLNEEIVELFYTQTYTPETICTPETVCAAFSQLLLRRWNLCCIVIYLRDEEGQLRESAMNADEHFDGQCAQRIAARLVAAVEREGRELQVWTDREADESPSHLADLSLAHEATALRAGLAIPIRARGTLVGALVALTVHPDRLRAALDGIRFIAPLIVIAVGNARRAQALREQHARIEELVEQLQQRGRESESANRELRHVAHYRSLFLRRMSHELRTPLTSMLGFAEILLEHEQLTETQRRFCQKIQDSGMQLQTSLNQLVDLSRLEAGQSELFLHEFSLRETLRESCAAVGRLAHKQHVEVDCQSSPNLPNIVSDEGKLRQVLYNFFAHAISRSSAGATIKVSAAERAPGRFLITIEDEGERIADLSHIFEPVDVSAPPETATGMNELGLVISRRLIDVLGATVQLDNAAPRGLKVSIELPACPSAEVQSSKFKVQS